MQSRDLKLDELGLYTRAYNDGWEKAKAILFSILLPENTPKELERDLEEFLDVKRKAYLDASFINKTDRKKRRRPNLSYIKDELIKRDGLKCFYCGKTLTKTSATVEHLLPFSLFRKTVFANLTLACQECNQRAANKPLSAKIKLRNKLRRSNNAE